jgi:hypothetical protein
VRSSGLAGGKSRTDSPDKRGHAGEQIIKSTNICGRIWGGFLLRPEEQRFATQINWRRKMRTCPASGRERAYCGLSTSHGAPDGFVPRCMPALIRWGLSWGKKVSAALPVELIWFMSDARSSLLIRRASCSASRRRSEDNHSGNMTAVLPLCSTATTDCPTHFAIKVIDPPGAQARLALE